MTKIALQQNQPDNGLSKSPTADVFVQATSRGLYNV